MREKNATPAPPMAEENTTPDSLVALIEDFRPTIKTSKNLARETDEFLGTLAGLLEKLDGAETTTEKEKDVLEDKLDQAEEQLAKLYPASDWADLIQEVLDREPDATPRKRFERLIEVMRYGTSTDPRILGARIIGPLN